jgi:hypothetical protein
MPFKLVTPDARSSFTGQVGRLCGGACPNNLAPARLPDHPASRIAELLPWNWKASRFDFAA